jgi:hypothetical protein
MSDLLQAQYTHALFLISELKEERYRLKVLNAELLAALKEFNFCVPALREVSPAIAQLIAKAYARSEELIAKAEQEGI